jgi:threonine aldolase
MTKIINLISDTVTKPSKAMLDAMYNAKVGDDVFKSDPTVIRLQGKLAEMFGKEDALFFPSGSMANQAAIKLHTNPGEQMICDKWAHVYNFEGGGAAANSGVSSLLIDGNRGMFKATQLEGFVNNPENIHTAITSLVSVENTTNKGGGACWDFEELKKIKKICTKNNLKFHLDGARLFNALVAKNESPKQYGDLFNTISICLSKGLGAPIGSVLLGDEIQINKALRIRKLFGGAMRQVGYLAAAGIYALDNNINRLADDHHKAKLLGETLQSLSFVKSVEPIETNIIIFNLIYSVKEEHFIEKLKANNILISNMGQGKLRMVTHLDFNTKMLEKVIKIFKMLKF